MRRIAREKAIELLYCMDVNSESIEEVLNHRTDEEDPLAVELATFCAVHLEQIDELIKNHLKNYTIERLNLVDKAILRLAVSEMLGGEPREVIINEALELTKKYSDLGDHKATSFNNRLLDEINKTLK